MNITADTIARTVVLALALINQVFAIEGRAAIPIAENDVYQIISLCWTIGASVAAWWKNNSFTAAARKADELKDELKAKR